MAKATKLRKARSLISNPANWCMGEYAKGPYGKLVPWSDKRAVQFCAEGAYRRTAGVVPVNELDQVAQLFGFLNGVTFNDSHTHDEVLWLFDLAIAIAEVEA